MKALIGQKWIPGWLDHYLGRTGYDSQQTEHPAGLSRPNNLWNPLPGDQGAHGRFGSRSRRHSVQLWFTTHRALTLALAAVGALGAVLASTDLVAMVPSRLVRGNAALQVVEPPLDIPGFELLMLWPERVHRDPAHQWLRDVIASSV